MVAAIIARRKKYIRAFKNANATCVQQAISLNDLGMRKGPIFNGLLRRDVIRHAERERYYLDEAVAKKMTEKRRKAAMIALIVILLALAIAFGVFKQ
ncbi:MAG: hypothetical protein ABIN67_01275 [Ferruginibacter sp.]